MESGRFTDLDSRQSWEDGQTDLQSRTIGPEGRVHRLTDRFRAVATNTKSCLEVGGTEET